MMAAVYCCSSAARNAGNAESGRVADGSTVAWQCEMVIFMGWGVVWVVVAVSGNGWRIH